MGRLHLQFVPLTMEIFGSLPIALKSRRRTSWNFGRSAWRHGLNFAIYVPADLVGIQSLLSVGAVSEACTEVQRLSMLGSDQAAALLAFMSLRGISWSGEEKDKILQRCRQAALQGNSYAQYVMALNERRQKNYGKEWEWLKMANAKEFGPSLAESGLLAARVIGRADLARAFFARGIRVRHIPSLVFLLSFCIRGTYGIVGRTLGIIAFPIATATMAIGVRYFPFSLSVF